MFVYPAAKKPPDLPVKPPLKRWIGTSASSGPSPKKGLTNFHPSLILITRSAKDFNYERFFFISYVLILDWGF